MRYLSLRNLISISAIFCFASVANASVPVIPSGQTFVCTPTHVWDGDGPVWCEEGPRLRLAGIAARDLMGVAVRAIHAQRQVGYRRIKAPRGIPSVIKKPTE